MEKSCTKCGEVKSVDKFGYRTSRIYEQKRPHSWCRDCRYAYAKKVRESKKSGIIIKAFASLPDYGANERIENFEELNNIF